MAISKSPDRHSFGKNSASKKLVENPNDEAAKQFVELYESLKMRDDELEETPEWEVNNMEYDLRSTDWIVKKVRDSDVYAQNLYAAMCNNDFIKNDIWFLLKEETWGCSWRHAGGVIAHMKGKGDYIDWYCTGIRNTYHDASDTERMYVAESIVTDEIRNDLLKLGWVVIEDKYPEE